MKMTPLRYEVCEHALSTSTYQQTLHVDSPHEHLTLQSCSSSSHNLAPNSQETLTNILTNNKFLASPSTFHRLQTSYSILG